MPRKTTRKATRKPLIGRTTALSIGAAAFAAGGVILTILARGRTYAASAGHAAPDLAPDRPHPGPDDRAPAAFRPDPTAPVPAAERDALAVPQGFPSMTTH